VPRGRFGATTSWTARSVTTVRHGLEYAGYRLGVEFLRRGPEAATHRAAARLARRTFDRGHRHTRITLANLAVAFPAKTEEERYEIGRESFVHFAHGLVDVARSTRWSDEELMRRVAFTGLENLDKAAAEGPGTLVLTPHLGSFELAIRAAPLYGLPILVTGRPLPNPLMRRDMNGQRTRTGAELILHRNVAHEMLRALHEKRPVVVMNDQYTRRSKAILAPFFGVRCHTTPGPATIALRSRAPVVLFYIVRDAIDRHRMVCLPPLEFERSGHLKRDIADFTALQNRAFEQVIREHPEQYMWSHRRFRNSPDLPNHLYGS